MRALTDPFRELSIYEDIIKSLKANGIAELEGCVDSARAPLEHALNPEGLNVVIACDDARAREIMDDWALFDRNVCYYPARDIIFYQSDLNGNLLTTERMCVMKALAEYSDGECLTVITTFDALMERIPAFRTLVDNVIMIAEGDTIDTGELAGSLTRCGYERAGEAEAAGQFAMREI